MLAPPSHISESIKNSQMNFLYHTETILTTCRSFCNQTIFFEKMLGKNDYFPQRGGDLHNEVCGNISLRSIPQIDISILHNFLFCCTNLCENPVSSQGQGADFTFYWSQQWSSRGLISCDLENNNNRKNFEINKHSWRLWKEVFIVHPFLGGSLWISLGFEGVHFDRRKSKMGGVV